MITDPVNWQAIEDALFDWFSDQTGMSVIWGNQDSPRPSSYPYGVMFITNGPQSPANAGTDEQIINIDLNQTYEEVEFEFGNQREMTLQLQILTGPGQSFSYANSPHAIMGRVQTSAYAPSVQEAFNTANISVLRVGDITDLSEVQDETWIGRVSMDLTVGLTSYSTERVGYIDVVEAEGTIKLNPDDPVTPGNPSKNAKITIIYNE